jgi:hypothetical protein
MSSTHDPAGAPWQHVGRGAFELPQGAAGTLLQGQGATAFQIQPDLLLRVFPNAINPNPDHLLVH